MKESTKLERLSRRNDLLGHVSPSRTDVGKTKVRKRRTVKLRASSSRLTTLSESATDIKRPAGKKARPRKPADNKRPARSESRGLASDHGPLDWMDELTREPPQRTKKRPGRPTPRATPVPPSSKEVSLELLDEATKSHRLFPKKARVSQKASPSRKSVQESPLDTDQYKHLLSLWLRIEEGGVNFKEFIQELEELFANGESDALQENDYLAERPKLPTFLDE